MIEININDSIAISNALVELLDKNRYAQVRAALVQLQNYEKKVSGRGLSEWVEAIKTLIKEKRYYAATVLMKDFDKYCGHYSAITHTGNPLHESINHTKWHTSWDGFFGKMHSIEDVIEGVFEVTINRECREIISNWRHSVHEIKAITFGSCFAREIANALLDLGHKSERFHLEESINTPYSIVEVLQILESGEGNEFLREKMFPKREKLFYKLADANLVVVTIGVGFYYKCNDGSPFIGKDYGSKIKSGEIKPYFPSVAELAETIIDIYDRIARLNHQSLKLLTLSPVPISGFIGGSGMFVADCVSKSNLRAAIDLAVSKTGFVYIPTFEIIKWIMPHVEESVQYRSFTDPRHPNDRLVKAIMSELFSGRIL